MDLFEEKLYDELIGLYKKNDLGKTEWEELFQRFSLIGYLPEAKPYILAMKFMGWGTEAAPDDVLKEMENLTDAEDYRLRGLYCDLKLIAGIEESTEEELKRWIDSGYTAEYLKQESRVYSMARVFGIGRKMETSYVRSTYANANVEALLKRGAIALEDSEWEEARGFFEQVLNNDAECADAYLGLAMSEGKLKTQEKFETFCIGRGLSDDKNLQRAKKYAISENKNYWEELEERHNEWLAASDKCRQRAKKAAHLVSFDSFMAGLRTDGTAMIATKNFKRNMRQDIAHWSNIKWEAAGNFYAVGLQTDGRVVTTVRNDEWQCKVSDWSDIAALAVGSYHTVGLKTDGTVVAVGRSWYGQCDVLGWSDIAAVAVGGNHTVGLKTDGTVVAVGRNEYGQCDVLGWSDIAAVAASDEHTVGLKTDGTVVAVGRNDKGQCNVSNWTNITAIAVECRWEGGTVGLKSDGTIVATGKHTWSWWSGITTLISSPWDIVGLDRNGKVKNLWKQRYDMGNWTRIVSVAVGRDSDRQYAIGVREDGTVVASGDNDDHQCDVSGWTDIVAVSAGRDFTIGLKSDGTMVMAGIDKGEQCDVSGWEDITAISSGERHTVGLKADGTVIAVGDDEKGQCDVSDWTDIVSVYAGDSHTIGLKANGAIVATGAHPFDKKDPGWKNITAVAVGSSHTVGLKKDHTVIAVGNNKKGECNVSGWKEIEAVAVGYNYTVGLKTDGTVAAAGDNSKGQCNVSDWADIVMVAVGWDHTVGLKTDGTVVAVGDNEKGECNVSDWTNIAVVAAGSSHTVGLKVDGTVVATGYNISGQCDVSGWTDIVAIFVRGYGTVGLKTDGTVVTTDKDFLLDGKLFSGLDDLDTIERCYPQMREHCIMQRQELERRRKEESERLAKEEAERVAKREERRRNEKLQELQKELESLQEQQALYENELSGLKGLFTGKRRKELEGSITWIDSEIDRVKSQISTLN